MSFAEAAQELDPGALISLFTLDCTDLMREIDPEAQITVFRWTPSSDMHAAVMFGGQAYQPFPVQVEGFEYSGKGPLPTPKLTVTNVSNLVGSLLSTYTDLVGAKLTRIRTFDRYLDGRPGADPTAKTPEEVFIVNQKTQHTPILIEWELRSILDHEGIMLPRRQALRDNCLWQYRVWRTTTGFDYTYASCPYTDLPMYDELDQQTTDPAKDQCSKKLSGCRLRYGTNPLPFGGFPGMARTPR